MRELFSRRKAKEKGELSDVYVYDVIPVPFRNQFLHLLDDYYRILNETINQRRTVDALITDTINDALAKMKGVYSINQFSGQEPLEAIKDYILQSNEQDCIDAVDHVLHIINFYSDHKYGMKSKLSSLIDEANYWMKYNNLGYEFVNDELLIKTNETIHQQIVLPALRLLNDSRFSGANEEMRKAYEFRRTGDNESAIIEANKAFESAMKSICVIQQYQYDPNDAASKLLDVLMNNGYFPAYLQGHLAAVCSSIKSGLPTVRNKTAGHGQGAQPRTVPNEYVDYALHILSTNLVFLIGLLPK